MHTGEGGWFGAEALKFWNDKEYYIDYKDKHWGFKNWNDWFTRRIRPEARPLPLQPKTGGVIVNSSDSYPLHYVEKSKGSNPAHNVQGYDNFWLKDNRYSLYDMLGA